MKKLQLKEFLTLTLPDKMVVLFQSVNSFYDTVTALQKEVEEIKKLHDSLGDSHESLAWNVEKRLQSLEKEPESQSEKHACIYVDCPHKKPESKSEWWYIDCDNYHAHGNSTERHLEKGCYSDCERCYSELNKPKPECMCESPKECLLSQENPHKEIGIVCCKCRNPLSSSEVREKVQKDVLMWSKGGIGMEELLDKILKLIGRGV